MNETKVSIVGTGRVAHHLLAALHNKVELIQLIGRDPEELKTLATPFNLPWTTEFSQILPAEIYILAISDDAISNVASDFNMHIPKDSIICHTSGTKPLKEITIHRTLAGIFYPLQSLTIGRKISYQEIPILITAVNPLVSKKLYNLAAVISSRVIHINDEERKHLHLAAVVINNHINHLMHLSKEYCKDHQLDFSLLNPLFQETFEKAKALGPFDSQTGPARRADDQTLRLHETMLEDYPIFQEIYTLISESILHTYHYEDIE